MNESLRLMRTFPAAPGEQAILANLQVAPFNRWAFRNMRRLLPTGNVWRGEGPVQPLQHESVWLDNIEFEDQNGVTLTVGTVIENGYMDGFVVLCQGVIVAERYADGVSPHEPHLLMSVTKSFTGSLTGILVEHGLLSPDDSVTDIIPEVKGSAYDGARVRHVLDMSVGMDYDEDYDNPESDMAYLDAAGGWRPPIEGAPDNLRDYIATMRPAGKHGETFHYVSTNTDLLGWILERVSGTDFATLLSREIWQPMGAGTDAYITLDRLGAPQTDGGLCVTTRDLARFGQLHLQNGVMQGRHIIPESWIRDFRETAMPRPGTEATSPRRCRAATIAPSGTPISTIPTDPSSASASTARCCSSIRLPVWCAPGTRAIQARWTRSSSTTWSDRSRRSPMPLHPESKAATGRADMPW